jgi:hypothetical protein
MSRPSSNFHITLSTFLSRYDHLFRSISLVAELGAGEGANVASKSSRSRAEGGIVEGAAIGIPVEAEDTRDML